jgi:hypothetical protein
MAISEDYQRIGKKLYIAAKYLIKYLSAGEKASSEVYRIAEERGIYVATLKRAMRIIKVKSRKCGHNWFMSLTEDAKERFESRKRLRGGVPPRVSQYGRPTIGAISTDWTLVRVDNDNNNTAKIGILEYGKTKPGLHMKVGSYEIEVDEDFPPQKLAALLLSLGGERSC